MQQLLTSCCAVLQAFRHLYVLATEPRFVEAIDVDSRASVYVPLKVSALQSDQVTIMDWVFSQTVAFTWTVAFFGIGLSWIIQHDCWYP